MTNPEITVVVPLYNKRREVGRCIQSVLAQSFPSFELVVVDDGSTDGGANVVRSIQDPRIRLIEQPNGGLASARNRGVVEGKAELIAFLDADDQWCPDFLVSIIAMAKLCPEAGVYFTAFWIHRGGGWARKVVIPRRYLRQDKPLLKDYFATPDGNVLPSASAVWKRSVTRAGMFRNMFGEDIDLWIRIAAMYPVAYSREAQAVWHLNASGRMCARQSEAEEEHKPDGLLPSIREITAEPDVSAAIKQQAFSYVAKRELRSVLQVYCSEGKEQALKLLSAWKATYGTPSSIVRFAMHSPRLFWQVVHSIRLNTIKYRNACSYLWYRREARNVLSR